MQTYFCPIVLLKKNSVLAAKKRSVFTRSIRLVFEEDTKKGGNRPKPEKPKPEKPKPDEKTQREGDKGLQRVKQQKKGASS